jgi:hypothetical protein
MHRISFVLELLLAVVKQLDVKQLDVKQLDVKQLDVFCKAESHDEILLNPAR